MAQFRQTGFFPMSTAFCTGTFLPHFEHLTPGRGIWTTLPQAGHFPFFPASVPFTWNVFPQSGFLQDTLNRIGWIS